MNGNWQGISQLMRVDVPLRVEQILAQAPPAPGGETIQPGAAVESGVNYLQGLLQSLFAFIPNLVGAVITLLIGLLIASFAKSLTRKILNSTDLDNRIAAGVMGRSDTGDLPKVEDLISNVVFWIIILFTAVAVLQTLQLQAVSQPLNTFLNPLASFAAWHKYLDVVTPIRLYP